MLERRLLELKARALGRPIQEIVAPPRGRRIKALTNAVPAPRKKIQQRGGKITAYVEVIDRILEEDRKAPQKQRHTAHRIWERLCGEAPGVAVCERSVR